MKKGLLIVMILPVLISSIACAVSAQNADKPYLNAKPEDMKWWRDARFGMFIHWGPVSIKGTEISWTRKSNRGFGHKEWGFIPQEEYDSLYKQFNPVNYDPKKIVAIAKAAGMKYVVLTTKHHDGFSMFATKQSDYNIINSPYGKDITKQLADACHEAGMKFGIYFTGPDWYHPDFETDNHGRFIEFFKNQVRELCTNYGKVSIFWFDIGGPAEKYDADNVFKMIRELQPGIIINDRLGIPADFSTPEQRVGAFNNTRPWETCMTIGDQWAYKPKDRVKSLKECLDVLISCACGDGNLLFNVGPSPLGEIEPEQITRLNEMGQWLNKYGETIYGTRGGPYVTTKWGGTTSKGNKVYIHVLRWPQDKLVLPALPHKVKSCKLLTGGKVEWEQNSGALSFAVSESDKDKIDTIIALELDAPVADLKPIKFPSDSLSHMAKAAASNTIGNILSEYGPSKAFDDDEGTRWATDYGVKSAWLEADLGRAKSFDRVEISEVFGRVRSFDLQYMFGGDWVTFYKGTTIGERFSVDIPEVTAKKVRLNILDATEGPTIYEFRLLKKTHGETAATKAKGDLSWWRNARFGMFVHWGPSSLTGQEISFARAGARPGMPPPWDQPGPVPVEIYDNLYKKFNPVKFNADKWVKVLKDAGMHYLVFTTKHCDSFSMFDTKQSEYNIMNTPYGRDICKQLADACHKHGVKLGWYYSCLDWYHPDFLKENHPKYIEFMHNQVRELLTEYGRVDTMWFDVGGPAERYDGYKLEEMIRSLQPGILINDRLGVPPDYVTPEQFIGGFNRGRPWETCMTIGDQWSYKPDDNIKSFEKCVEILVRCASGDGNLLLNIGPKPDGEMEAKQVEILKRVGEWLRENGESIYGTRGGPFIMNQWGGSTNKGNKVYLHILDWPSEWLVIPNVKAKVSNCSLIDGGKVNWSHHDSELRLTVPREMRDKVDTIVVLEMDTLGEYIDIIEIAGKSLAAGKAVAASNVHQKDNQYSAMKAFDNDPGTRWACDGGVTSAWIGVDLDEPTTFDIIEMDEAYDRVQEFELQHKDGTDWVTFHKGTKIGDKCKLKFDPITTSVVRLNILKSTDGPSFSEIRIMKSE